MVDPSSSVSHGMRACGGGPTNVRGTTDSLAVVQVSSRPYIMAARAWDSRSSRIRNPVGSC
eukprot:990678-Prorocentrum_minimum.AAC.6